MDRINIDKLNELENSGAIDAQAASDLRNLDKQGVGVKWNNDGTTYEYINKDGYTYSGKTGKGTRKGLFRGANRSHKNISDAMAQLKSFGGFDTQETLVKRSEETDSSQDKSKVPADATGKDTRGMSQAEIDAMFPKIDWTVPKIEIDKKPTTPIKLEKRPEFPTSIYSRQPGNKSGFTDKGLFENILQGANVGNESGILPSIGRQADDLTRYIGGHMLDFITPTSETDYSDEAVKGLRSRQSIATAKLLGANYDEWGETIRERDFADAYEAGLIDENGEATYEEKDNKWVHKKTGELLMHQKTPIDDLGFLAPDITGAGSKVLGLASKSTGIAGKLRNFYSKLRNTKVGNWGKTAGKAIDDFFPGLDLGTKATTAGKQASQKLIEGARPVVKMLEEASPYTKGLTKKYNAAQGTIGTRTILSNKKGGKLPTFKKGGIYIKSEHGGTLDRPPQKTGKPVWPLDLLVAGSVPGDAIQKAVGGVKFELPGIKTDTASLQGIKLDELGKIASPKKLYSDITINPKVEKVDQLRGKGDGKVNQADPGSYNYIKTPVGDVGYGDAADLALKLATSKRPKFQGITLQPHKEQPQLKGIVEKGLSSAAQNQFAEQAANVQAQGDNTADALINRQDDLARAMVAKGIETQGTLANEAEINRRIDINRDIENKNLIAKGQTQTANENLINVQAAEDQRLANAQIGANNKFLSQVGESFISTRQRAGYNEDVSNYNNRIELDKKYSRDLGMLEMSGISGTEYDIAKEKLMMEYEQGRQKFTRPEGVTIYDT